MSWLKQKPKLIKLLEEVNQNKPQQTVSEIYFIKWLKINTICTQFAKTEYKSKVEKFQKIFESINSSRHYEIFSTPMMLLLVAITPQASAAAGLHCDTAQKPNAAKAKIGNNGTLDQVVGCMWFLDDLIIHCPSSSGTEEPEMNNVELKGLSCAKSGRYCF